MRTLLQSINFVAIDFELANSSHGSICSVGVTRVRGGNVEEPKHWFVRPPAGYDFMLESNMHLTGIRPHHIADAPGFDVIGPMLLRNIGSVPIVAHSAVSAEISMFEQSWVACGKPGVLPPWHYVCTLRAAREAFPGLPAYRLNMCSAHILGVEMEGHHRADVDAHVTAQLMLEVVKSSGQPMDSWASIRAANQNRTPAKPKRFGAWQSLNRTSTQAWRDAI